MSSTSPQFDYDSESTATNSNTKEKRKFFNNTDEFSDLKTPVTGGQRKSIVVSQFKENEESPDWPRLGETKERSQTHKSSPKKFKTELCKNWELTGKCSYRDKCQFAHGKHELLVNPQVILNEKYKSKQCKQYHTQQFCPYGSRCLFAHDMRDQEAILGESHYQKILNNLSEFGIPQQQSRLPFLEKLTADPFCFSKTFPNSIGILLPNKI